MMLMMHRGFLGGIGGRAGPGEDLLEGRPVGPDAGFADALGQAGQAVVRGSRRPSRARLAIRSGVLAVEDIVEAGLHISA